MITCERCTHWHPELCKKEDYGECKNAEHIARMIHEARHTYKFNERQQYIVEKQYKPYITAKDHRCIAGEARNE